MSRTLSALIRIDNSGNTVTLTVTGGPTSGEQQELTRMTARTRALFPDAAVTVDLSSTRAPTTTTGNPSSVSPPPARCWWQFPPAPEIVLSRDRASASWQDHAEKSAGAAPVPCSLRTSSASLKTPRRPAVPPSATRLGTA